MKLPDMVNSSPAANDVDLKFKDGVFGGEIRCGMERRLVKVSCISR